MEANLGDYSGFYSTHNILQALHKHSFYSSFHHISSQSESTLVKKAQAAHPSEPDGACRTSLLGTIMLAFSPWRGGGGLQTMEYALLMCPQILQNPCYEHPPKTDPLSCQPPRNPSLTITGNPKQRTLAWPP